MTKFSISAKYWASLTEMEQEYMKQRVSSGKDNISGVKEIIREARKQLPGFTKIYGKGFVEKDGKTYVYSGSDTRRFLIVKADAA